MKNKTIICACCRELFIDAGMFSSGLFIDKAGEDGVRRSYPAANCGRHTYGEYRAAAGIPAFKVGDPQANKMPPNVLPASDA